MTRLARIEHVVAVTIAVVAALGTSSDSHAEPVPLTFLETPAESTKDVTPTWTFTGEPGATFRCTLIAPFEGQWQGGSDGNEPEPDDVTIESTACNSGTYSYDLSAFNDHGYVLTVGSRDAAGEEAGWIQDSFRVDRFAYPTTLSTRARDLSDDTTPTWRFYGEYLASFECVLTDDTSATVIDRADCAGPGMDQSYTFDLGPYPDGAYTLTITQTDQAGNVSPPAVDSFVLSRDTPNAPPTASFTYSCIWLTCNFDGYGVDSDGWVASYWWSFGDGDTQPDRFGHHMFDQSGTYPVTLTVTDDQGAIGTATVDVTVQQQPPNAAPTAAFTWSCAGLGCTLDATGSTDDGVIETYRWEFGDGSPPGVGRAVEHSYLADGDYPVTLSVIDNRGGEASTSQLLTVAANPPPPTTIQPTVPGAPRTVTARPIGTTAEVRFSAPLSDGGSPITAYTARCISSNGGITRQTQGPGSPINVTTLGRRRTYTCTVRAANAIGTGPASSPTTAFRVSR